MQFLIEQYSTPATELDPVLRLSRVAETSMTAIRYIGIVHLPDDETTFHLIEAPDIDALQMALRDADIQYDRIVVAVAALATAPGGQTAPE